MAYITIFTFTNINFSTLIKGSLKFYLSNVGVSLDHPQLSIIFTNYL